MRITPISHGLEELIGKSTGYRSPGLHMSTLYGDLYNDLEPLRYKRGTTPDPLYLEAGLAFEELLEAKLKERLGPHLGERPPEQMTEEEWGGVGGIAYSPDLLIFDEKKGLVLGEIKLTWQSCRTVPTDTVNIWPPQFDRYLTQVKAYCFHLRTVHARLLIFFINGDYRPPVPVLRAYDLEFTQRELEECWSMLKNHGRSKGLI